MGEVALERSVRRSAVRVGLLLLLCPPCFVAGLIIGGCGPSVRDDFLTLRGLHLEPIAGDASAYRHRRTQPQPGFVVAEPLLTRAPEE